LTKRPLYTGMHYLNDGFSIWNSEADSDEKRKRVVNAMVQEDGFVVTLKRIGKDEEIFVHYHDPDCPESEHEAPKGKKRATKKGSGGEDDSDEEEEEEEPEGDGRGSKRKAKLKGNRKRKAEEEMDKECEKEWERQARKKRKDSPELEGVQAKRNKVTQRSEGKQKVNRWIGG